jgi:hypothetical protein
MVVDVLLLSLSKLNFVAPDPFRTHKLINSDAGTYKASILTVFREDLADYLFSPSFPI